MDLRTDFFFFSFFRFSTAGSVTGSWKYFSQRESFYDYHFTCQRFRMIIPNYIKVSSFLSVFWKSCLWFLQAAKCSVVWWTESYNCLGLYEHRGLWVYHHCCKWKQSSWGCSVANMLVVKQNHKAEFSPIFLVLKQIQYLVHCQISKTFF